MIFLIPLHLFQLFESHYFMENNSIEKKFYSGRLIFDHLPKTAGQAINAWLVSQLGYGCVSNNLIGNQRDLIRQYGGIIPVISGHINFDGDRLNPFYQYVTCLREPIDRAISNIFFINEVSTRIRLSSNFKDVSGFFESDGVELSDDLRSGLSNPYVSHFICAGDTVVISEEAQLNKAKDIIRQYDVVGLYEEMPNFLTAVARLLGLSAPSPLPKVNVTKARPAIDQISLRVRQRLQELNVLDLELYHWVRVCLKQRKERSTVSLQAVCKWALYNRIEFIGSDARLLTQCGRLNEARLVSNREAGFLIYGQYIRLAKGQYEARLSVSHDSVLVGAWMDVVSSGAEKCWARLGLPPPPISSTVVIAFELTETCVDLEVRLWVPAGADVTVNSLSIESVLQPAVKPNSSLEDSRIAMTVLCNDCGAIPKVPDAGEVLTVGGQMVQLMHDGTRVVAGGYFGEWMQTVIQQLQGHHEPQEELLFHTLLKHARPGSLMVEFGCYWAYYSNWYLGAVPQSTTICIEPDENRLRVGQQNVALNQREAIFHLAAAGGQFQAEHAFVRESDGASVVIPMWDFGKLLEQIDTGCIELLHLDIQGAELPFLQSIVRTQYHGRLRFVVVSTHHNSISGSAVTHRDCLVALINAGAFILCEHKVEESFSGDGLIVASFNAKDAHIPMPTISRNRPENSLFGPDPKREIKLGAKESAASQSLVLSHELADQVEVVQTADGPMRIFKGDAVIGAALKSTGAFQTEKIDEVSTFLRERFEFTHELFVDIGANIGTHIVHALKSGGFKRGLAFEPDPANYALLTQNISETGLSDKVKAFKLALSSRSGATTFELCGSNFGDHRVRVDGVKPSMTFDENKRRLISVLADTGDEFFEENDLNLSPETLIWVDTQGHEGHVFTGLGKLLAGVEKPFVVCEFWPYGLERAGGKEMFFDFMRSCKVFYDINQSNWQKHPKIKLEILESMYQRLLSDTRDGHYPHSDLLCIL